MKQYRNILFALLLMYGCSSCLTLKKLDAFVAEQYGNQVPKLNKKNAANLTVSSTLPKTGDAISVSRNKTSNFLPLILYWHYEFRRVCALNPDIAANTFTNALNNASSKTLQQKLQGKTLELTVEQAPVGFSFTEKTNIIFVVYVISWSRLSVEPDFKDLVVSYKLTNADGTSKTGTIQVKNPMRDKGLRLFQSWKSAVSEYITEYNYTINNMAKSFAGELMKEL